MEKYGHAGTLSSNQVTRGYIIFDVTIEVDVAIDG